MFDIRRWVLPGALTLTVFAAGCNRQQPTTSALDRPAQPQQATAQSQDQAATPAMRASSGGTTSQPNSQTPPSQAPQVNNARKTMGVPATPANAGAARSNSAPAADGPPRMAGTSIPAGTAISVRTTDRISTKGATAAGDRWYGSLEAPIEVNGRTIAPRGSRVVGEVTNADDGGRVKGRASLSVRMLSVETPGGQSIPIRTESFTAVAKSGKKSDAAKIGIGAGIGAAIGAIAGGGKGAAIGAASGGAAGTGVVLATEGADAVIPAETVLNLRTAQAVTVR